MTVSMSSLRSPDPHRGRQCPVLREHDLERLDQLAGARLATAHDSAHDGRYGTRRVAFGIELPQPGCSLFLRRRGHSWSVPAVGHEVTHRPRHGAG
jgi:hypothetical protein